MPNQLVTDLEIDCPLCDSSRVKIERQKFKNRTTHYRAVCRQCGKFIKYVSKKSVQEVCEPEDFADDIPAETQCKIRAITKTLQKISNANTRQEISAITRAKFLVYLHELEVTLGEWHQELRGSK